MSLVQIPTLTDGTTAYRIRTRLEGQDWLFDFTWNTRTSRWAFDVSALDGTGVVTGQAVVVGVGGLLGRAVGGPLGQLAATSSDGTDTAPGLRELGDRVRLFYITSDDELLA